MKMNSTFNIFVILLNGQAVTFNMSTHCINISRLFGLINFLIYYLNIIDSIGPNIGVTEKVYRHVMTVSIPW